MKQGLFVKNIPNIRGFILQLLKTTLQMKYAIKKILCNSVFLRRSLFIGFFFLIETSIQAQVNYVPNPSFEKLDSCYFYSNTINAAKPWDTLVTRGGGGPSLFNKCSFGIANRAPNTGAGFRIPRTGTGILAEDIFISISLVRFYSQVPLKQTLQNGKSYTVSFYVSRCACSQYCIDRIGAYLDNGSISTTYGGLVNVIPQVENPQHHIITDTVNWTKIQGCFIANGTESYLTLGNFYPDNQVDTASAPYNPSYGVVNNSSYFFDDVSVIESNSQIQADNDTTILKGDTITLGKSIEGMPVDWYDIQGNLLAASSTINVSPATTTSYVVRMDLCGNVSYDTVVVSVSVGIEQLAFENGQSRTFGIVYPNPASQSIVVSSKSLVNTIEVRDVLGRVVIQQIKNSSTQQLQIDVSGLSNGLYFIKATDTKGNVMNAKFVKE
ncbi:MAG: hypothetical protein RJA07_1999 [Bacteroidota bacterium]|jgi:hypothetical protein